MRYDPLPATRSRTKYVPRLDGGLNLDDIPQSAADNQITACRNMWWHDGALRTRPGLNSIGALIGTYNIVQPLGEGELLFIHYEPDGEGHRLFYAALQRADGSQLTFSTSSFEPISMPHDASAPVTAFGCHAPHGREYDFIFFFGSGEIITYAEDTGYLTYTSGYVPHVSTDGAPTVALRAGSPAGTVLEYPNLLSEHGVCTYTTDGAGTYFYLPASFRGARLTLSLTLHDPAYSEVVTIDPTVARTFQPAAFDLDPAQYTRVVLGYQYNAARGYFRLYGTATRADGGTETVPLPPDSRNNLRVTMSGYHGYDPTRICRMTLTAWYGGTRSGVGGGTRLFVAGNGDAPHLLHWSHVDDPLYFPDRNYAYVGNSDTPITALGKQSDLLIIFKAHETFAAEYVSSNDPITEVMPHEDNEPQPYRAYFPLTPLHPTVGCDCPATLQLVNNKLVWMTADGRLYMLTGVDRRSNRNVRQISAPIAPALAAHTDAERRAASGGAYDGRYMLAVGRTVYVLDCRTTAFNRYGQYADEMTALRALSYYRWEMPHDMQYLLLSGGGALIVIWVDTTAVVVNRLEGDTDGGAPISTSFTTRLFGADDPTRRMSVPAVYIGISDTHGRVRVTYHTDRGDTVDPAVVTGNSITPDGRRITPRRLRPNIHRAAYFGITCESDVAFAVTDLSIITRADGAIR